MKMEILQFSTILIVFSTIAIARRLRCLQCSQSHFLGEPGLDICYKVDGSMRNTSYCESDDVDGYCFTKVEISDGVISFLERGCTNTREDEMQSHDYPGSVKCRTTYSTAPNSRVNQQTECYLPCPHNNCNDIPILENMNSCPRSCPQNSECNHVTGKCQCSHNRSGEECNSPVQVTLPGLSCVQCSSKTNRGCANKTSGSRCLNGESHCSTTQTWILNPDGTLADDAVITRACAGSYLSPDRCYFSKTSNMIVADYTEYTCISTCSTDNCNTGQANGVIDGEEFLPMKCVVCEGDESKCGPNTRVTRDCPGNTTHCRSTITYWQSSINDSVEEGRLLPEPSISIRSIKRECASSAVTPQCTSRKVANLNLEEIMCQETCVGDGCNTGWPTRPKCAQCQERNHDSVGKQCAFYPQNIASCPGPHHAHCYFYLQNRTRFQNQQVLKNQIFIVKRGCSTETGPSGHPKCTNIIENGKKVGIECSRYCSTHGCNFNEEDVAFTPGLTCYSCSNSDFNGESTFSRECFTTSSSTPTETCLTNTPANMYYCRTVFSLQDGMVVSVNRGCISTSVDEVSISTTVPTDNKCETSISIGGEPVDTTQCYYHCTTDDCNTVTTTTLKTCPSDCSRTSGQGACNYITGDCVCNAGYSGSDCSNTIATVAPSYRSCIQCNSDSESECASFTSGSICPDNQQYCSSARTMIFDLTTNPEPVRTIITRGCTSDWTAVDECEFSNIYIDTGLISSGYSEYTCYSTCNTDNCNTNTPDGTVNGPEQKILHCQQCTGSGADCNVARTPCPASSTHCKATVVYLISPKTDRNYEGATPDYELESVVRECATASVTTECTETDVINSLSLKKVTCQETCQSDGCNTGWPARPTCIQCATSTIDLVDGYDQCLENPTLPTKCQYPYQSYCYIYDDGLREGRRESVSGYPRRIARGCTHYDMGNGCSTKTIREIEIQQCNVTCSSDGCNVGSDASVPLPTVILLLLSTLFGWITKFYA